MLEKKMNSLSIWGFEVLLKYTGATHFISTRMGGVSMPPYDFLNLGFHVGDTPEAVLRNRGILASTLSISLDRFTFAEQIHGAGVKVVTEEQRGSGVTEHQTSLYATDAMVTDVPDICLIVLLGDCVPVIFFDPIKNVVGVAHAGWRGTVRSVIRNTVMVFQERFGSSPSDLVAGIGPSIGPCCYEVGPEVLAQVENTFSGKNGCVDNETPDGKGYLNLWQANKAQLMEMGVLESNIELSGICTCCNHDNFFSRRYQGGETGRFGAGICLKTSKIGVP